MDTTPSRPPKLCIYLLARGENYAVGPLMVDAGLVGFVASCSLELKTMLLGLRDPV